MRGLIRPATLMLILAVLLAGCEFKMPRLLRFERAPAPAGETTQPTEQPTPPPPVLADALFPAQDWRLTYAVTDLGQEPVQVVEELIRDESRLVATYNGSPYITWVFNDEGVWRSDPKGGGALLLYLPKNLLDGDAWKQTSGDADVWFRLKESREACPGWFWAGQPEQCWELTVLNRGERTRFAMVTGLGPTFAQAENWAAPAESFSKKATAHRAGQLSEEQRKQVLDSVKLPTTPPAPVIPVSSGEFETAATDMMAKYLKQER